MNRFSPICAALACWALFAAPALAVDANTCGFVQGDGGWYSQTDRSGPYTVDGNCNPTLVSGGGTTTSGALQPPTAASGKIIKTVTALAVTTSTTIAAANANRIALVIQCASGSVSVDETGGTLTAAAVGNGTLFIPTGTGPYSTPPIATLTAITAYSGTAQTCVVTEYLR